MPKGYSRAQIGLHWIVFLLVAVQFLFNGAIVEAWADFVETAESAFDPFAAAHVFGGLLVLALVLWRLVLRARRGAPPPPAQEPRVLRMAAHAAHWSLYALLILMPVTGALAWFGALEQAAGLHSVLRFALLALIALHILAALYHQFLLRDGLMARMRHPQ
ncbi:cytochrome B [Rhodobacteraceae bacterium WD3A24]|nr:cytochrome B [Rhodobacteraceae bacterium WD3A24]